MAFTCPLSIKVADSSERGSQTRPVLSTRTPPPLPMFPVTRAPASGVAFTPLGPSSAIRVWAPSDRTTFPSRPIGRQYRIGRGTAPVSPLTA